MASGQLTSRELTLGYLGRIRELNPLLHAVIETNPRAVAIAARLDAERRAGHLRGDPSAGARTHHGFACQVNRVEVCGRHQGMIWIA